MRLEAALDHPQGGSTPTKEKGGEPSGLTAQSVITHVDGNEVEFTYDDMEPLADLLLPGDPHDFVYYTLRVTQADEEMAWSSPIWVDHEIVEPVEEEAEEGPEGILALEDDDSTLSTQH